MVNPGKWPVRSALLVCLLLLLLVATAVFAYPPTETAEAYETASDLVPGDSPPEFPQDEPHTVTMQIIDNEFYKWREYRGEDQFFIYLLEPEERPLDSGEARELLQASAQWMENAPWNDERVEFLEEKVPGSPQPPPAADAGSAEPEPEEEELESVFMSSEGANAGLLQARGIFGPDERLRVTSEYAQDYPWNTIGYVQTHYRLSGSGFLVSPHAAITNAHNIFRSEYGGWSDQLMFYPGQTQDEPGGAVTRPFSGQQAVDAAIPRGYRTHEDNIERSVAYDYAAMFFEEPFQEISTFMPLEFNYEPHYVHIAGYPPRVRDETNSRALWHGFGPVTGVLPDTLLFQADASEGHSGGPIWVHDGASGTDRVVGTIAVIGSQYNAGPRFATHNQGLLEEWMRWTPGQGAREHSLFISIQGEGFTQPEPGEHKFTAGEQVELQAEPADGWEFDRWVVDGEVVDKARFNLTLDSDREAVAHFRRRVSQVADGVSFSIGSPIYFVNGEEKNLDVAPFIVDGRTYIPMRPLAESLGAEADWQPRSGRVESVVFRDGEREVKADIGETSLQIRDLENGHEETITMDVAPVIRDGRTFLPFRFLAQAFGAEVDYATVPGSNRVDRVWFSW